MAEEKSFWRWVLENLLPSREAVIEAVPGILAAAAEVAAPLLCPERVQYLQNCAKKAQTAAMLGLVLVIVFVGTFVKEVWALYTNWKAVLVTAIVLVAGVLWVFRTREMANGAGITAAGVLYVWAFMRQIMPFVFPASKLYEATSQHDEIGVILACVLIILRSYPAKSLTRFHPRSSLAGDALSVLIQCYFGVCSSKSGWRFVATQVRATCQIALNILMREAFADQDVFIGTVCLVCPALPWKKAVGNFDSQALLDWWNQPSDFEFGVAELVECFKWAMQFLPNLPTERAAKVILHVRSGLLSVAAGLALATMEFAPTTSCKLCCLGNVLVVALAVMDWRTRMENKHYDTMFVNGMAKDFFQQQVRAVQENLAAVGAAAYGGAVAVRDAAVDGASNPQVQGAGLLALLAYGAWQSRRELWKWAMKAAGKIAK